MVINIIPRFIPLDAKYARCPLCLCLSSAESAPRGARVGALEPRGFEHRPHNASKKQAQRHFLSCVDADPTSKTRLSNTIKISATSYFDTVGIHMYVHHFAEEGIDERRVVAEIGLLSKMSSAGSFLGIRLRW